MARPSLRAATAPTDRRIPALARTTTTDTKLRAVPTPRSPGITKRAARVERAAEQLREQVRRELDATGNPYDESDVQALAIERLDELLATDPGVRKQFLLTAPTSTSPRRDGLFEKVEVAAIRRTSQACALESLFSGAGAPRGRRRPSDRRLPIAVFERNAWEMGRPEVRANVRDFLGSDALLDWAYDEPVTSGVHERSVLETMQAMLDRHDPETTGALNLEAIRDLADRHKDVGRYVAIDGTHVQAWLDQSPDYGAAHKRALNRGMHEAAFATHGRHYWRGHTLLVLTCLKTTLPLAWILTPANQPEFQAVTPLIDLLYEHCPIAQSSTWSATAASTCRPGFMWISKSAAASTSSRPGRAAAATASPVISALGTATARRPPER